MQRSWQFLCLALLIGSLSLVGCASTEEMPSETTETTTTTTTPTTNTTVMSFEDYKPRLQCPKPKEQKEGEEKFRCEAVIEMVIQSESEINGKSILIAVNGDDAPITAGNFVDLVERGVYDGLAFHRVIRDPEPFVAQGGDPAGKDVNVPVSALGRGGFTDPATGVRRDLPLEIKLAGDETPTYGQAKLDPSKVVLKHEKGAIAMARSQFPNSASAQFYFSLANHAFLDGDYAVFGKVTEGLDVMDKIQMGDRIKSAKVIEGADYLVK